MFPRLLWDDHSNERCLEVFSCLFYSSMWVLTFESVDKIVWRCHSKETCVAVFLHRNGTCFLGVRSALFVGKLLRCYYPKTYCLLVTRLFGIFLVTKRSVVLDLFLLT